MRRTKLNRIAGWVIATNLSCISGCTTSTTTISAVGINNGNRGRERVLPVRSTLLSGYAEPEEPRYGAYSYILLKPTSETDPRMLALIGAWIKWPTALETQVYESPDRLNLTLLPLRQEPKIESSTDAAKLYLQQYDRARAEALLFDLHLSDSGPYIVTSTEPLSMASAPAPCAVLDLSNAKLESMAPWVRYFQAVSSEPEQWAKHGAMLMALKLHDRLAGMGEVLAATLAVTTDGTRLLKAFEPAAATHATKTGVVP